MAGSKSEKISAKKKNGEQEYGYDYDEDASLELLLSLSEANGALEPPTKTVGDTSSVGHDAMKIKPMPGKTAKTSGKKSDFITTNLPQAVTTNEKQKSNTENESWKQSVYKKISTTFGLSREVLESDPDISAEIPWFGQILGGASEMADRGGGWDGLGAASTGILTDNLLAKARWGEAGGGVSGIAGSGLKFISALKGEEDSPNLQIKDAAEAVDLVSTLSSTTGIVTEGIREGFMGAYDTLNNTLDWAVTGDPKKLLEQYEKQRKGESGGILQGGTMIADVAEAMWNGDWSSVGELGALGEQGKLGSLPKLGDRIIEGWGMLFDAGKAIHTGDWSDLLNRTAEDEARRKTKT